MASRSQECGLEPSAHSSGLDAEPSAAKKASYIGAPAVFALEQACREVNDAFNGYGCYLVGSAMVKPDWRDVDVRLIMSDEAFQAEFPGAGPVEHVHWEFDSKWLLLTISISERLSKVTGLPIDFQFQPQSHANKRHKGPRSALGMRLNYTADDEEIGPPTPLGALRFRMEQGGHTQADLAKLLGSRARASEILAGTRTLSKAQIRLLNDEWGIPARSLLGLAQNPATEPQ